MPKHRPLARFLRAVALATILALLPSPSPLATGPAGAHGVPSPWCDYSGARGGAREP